MQAATTLLGQKMHEHSLNINEELVIHLLRSQFPKWAHLTVNFIDSHGTDNAIFRLGTNMCIRLPKIEWAANDAMKEQRLLKLLANKLPLAVPSPIELGIPDKRYPWHWSIYNFIDGDNALNKKIDLNKAATQMADFLLALRKVDSENAPLSRRGEPLKTQDHEVQKALNSLAGLINNQKAHDIWQECLKAPLWGAPPVWLHGDLLPGNLLVKDGNLCAVIDWGLSGIGDPACDLIIGYSLLKMESRRTFRAPLAIDDAMWLRGLGWALSISLIILPYYWSTNPKLVAIAKSMLEEVFLEASFIGIV